MIREGSNGSMNFFFKDRLVCSCPLTKKKDVKYYEDEVNEFIINCMKIKKMNFHDVQMLCVGAVETIRNTKRYKLTRDFERHACVCFLCLIKLQIFEFDTICLVMKKKSISPHPR